jgi:hypothetical protein
MDETSLWAWFLFRSGLPAQRAKTLLTEWTAQNLTLAAALEGLPARAAARGLTPDEAARLRPPAQLPAVRALRWNEALYPRQLYSLPLKLRPALLFYLGEVSLLMRPIVYLKPDALSAADEDLLRELISLLLGEYFLPATFHGTRQAELLLEELADSEGELLLLARRGLADMPLTEPERTLLAAQRLLVATPLPPETLPNPAWDTVLFQVAQSTAAYCVTTTPPTAADPQSPPTVLLSAASGMTLPAYVHTVADAAEAAQWLTDGLSAALPPAAPTSEWRGAAESAWAEPPLDASPLGESLPPEPPPPPAEVLRLLESGGHVPEVLRKRLLG